MSKTLQKGITFSGKAKMVQAEMNSYLNIPVCSLISSTNVKYGNKINNNYRASHTHISNRKDDEQHFN